MEIIIKNKKYEIIKELDSSSILVKRKNKHFKVIKYDENSFNDFLNYYSRISHCGINIFKVVAIDKKNRYVLCKYLEGESVLNLLIKGDLTEDIYQQIFNASWYGKMGQLKFNFSPDKWLLVGSKLYYSTYEVKPYNKDDDFVKTDAYLWFYSKSLVKYLKELGLPVDESRLKSEYDTTLEVLKMVAKFYK